MNDSVRSCVEPFMIHFAAHFTILPFAYTAIEYISSGVWSCFEDVHLVQNKYTHAEAGSAVGVFNKKKGISCSLKYFYTA